MQKQLAASLTFCNLPIPLNFNNCITTGLIAAKTEVLNWHVVVLSGFLGPAKQQYIILHFSVTTVSAAYQLMAVASYVSDSNESDNVFPKAANYFLKLSTNSLTRLLLLHKLYYSNY